MNVTDTAASFYAIHHRSDVLTVPSAFYRHIVDMKGLCADGGLAALEDLLEQGRRVFADPHTRETPNVPPEWQCVHLPGSISVPWLHLHTFIGSIPAEGLPGTPPQSSCVRASVPVASAAAEMLRASVRAGGGAFPVQVHV